VIAVIPIGGEVTLFGETFTLVVADLSIGVLWILALGLDPRLQRRSWPAGRRTRPTRCSVGSAPVPR
jgi:hypothetical protein